MIENRQSPYIVSNSCENAKKILEKEWKTRDSAEEAESDISKVQGSQELRNTVVSIMHQTSSLEFLSPKSLQAAQEQNIFLYRLLTFKRIGHVFSLKGNIPIEGKKISLEGFHETFTYPMIGSSFKAFACQKNNENLVRLAQIIESIFIFNISNDTCSDSKIAMIGNRRLPLLVGTGWKWHSIQMILYTIKDNKKVIAFCNKGQKGVFGSFGWKLYLVHKSENISATWLKKMAMRLSQEEHSSFFYKGTETIHRKFQLEKVRSHRMKTQKSGNCTYASIKSALSCLLFLHHASPLFKKKVDKRKMLKTSIKASQNLYKQFTAFDRKLVLSNFLLDLNAAASSPSPDPGVVEMSKLIYCKLLTTPTLGFKIGWQLWKEVVLACQKLHSPPTLIPDKWIQLAEEFAMDQKTPSDSLSTQLLKIGEIFSKKHYSKKIALSILKNLFVRGETSIAFEYLISVTDDRTKKDSLINALIKILLDKKLWKQTEALLPHIQSHLLKLCSRQDLCSHFISSKFFSKAIEMAETFSAPIREFYLNKIIKKLIKLDRIQEAKEIVVNRCSYGHMNTLSKKLFFLGRLDEAKEITALIPENQQYIKYSYITDICPFLIQKEKLPLALNLIDEIPDGHLGKTSAIRSLSLYLIEEKKDKHLLLEIINKFSDFFSKNSEILGKIISKLESQKNYLTALEVLEAIPPTISIFIDYISLGHSLITNRTFEHLFPLCHLAFKLPNAFFVLETIFNLLKSDLSNSEEKEELILTISRLIAELTNTST